MKTKILAVVSTIAIMATTHASAETKSKPLGEQPSAAEKIQDNAQKAWSDVKEGTQEVYEDIKAQFLDNAPEAKITEVTFDPRKTANGMIGKAVLNPQENKVGTVQDIILDSSGNASMVIIADSDFPGFSGKLVAIDYSVLSMRDSNGDLLAPLTENVIDKIVGFSYDPKDRSDTVRIIPDQGISVATLLQGQLLDAQANAVAEIDNITLKNGRATDIIVGFDKTLGIGGEKLALAYKDTNLVRVEDGFDFQLSANQAAQFGIYKRAVSN